MLDNVIEFRNRSSEEAASGREGAERASWEVRVAGEGCGRVVDWHRTLWAIRTVASTRDDVPFDTPSELCEQSNL